MPVLRRVLQGHAEAAADVAAEQAVLGGISVAVDQVLVRRLGATGLRLPVR